MQRLEVSGAVRPIYGSLGVKRLMEAKDILLRWQKYFQLLLEDELQPQEETEKENENIEL